MNNTWGKDWDRDNLVAHIQASILSISNAIVRGTLYIEMLNFSTTLSSYPLLGRSAYCR